MSLFDKNKKPAAPSAKTPAPKSKPMAKKSIFGGITKPKAAFAKNYFTPGKYRLKVSKVLVGVSENPDHKNEDFGLAVFEVVEVDPPNKPASDGSAPQPVGADVSMTKYFAGPACDFALRDWRNLMCAVLGIDEGGVDWPNLTEEEVAEFESACDHVAENPEEYVGTIIECDCYEQYNKKRERYFTQQMFSPVD